MNTDTNGHHTHRRGFTLLEISVVLVVIALIAAGVVVGKDLIREAEMRKFATDLTKYEAAILMFNNKYKALPGDFSKAGLYWGSATGTDGNCTDPLNDVGTDVKFTCNGNGDGWIGDLATPGQRYEWFRSWQHMQNAGMLETGNFSGVSADSVAPTARTGINVPGTSMAGVGFTVLYYTLPADLGSWFAGQYRNMFSIGRDTTTGETRTSFLTPQEAYSYDLKYDDGIASTGSVLGRNNIDCAARPAAGAPAVYLIGSSEVKTCMLRYKLNF